MVTLQHAKDAVVSNTIPFLQHCVAFVLAGFVSPKRRNGRLDAHSDILRILDAG